MINLYELRIGNWVNGASRGLPEKVTAALLNGIEKGNVVVIPILLTPKILRKAGFVEFTNVWVVKSEMPETKFFIHTTDNSSFYFDYGLRSNQAIEIKYLHQLQSLYFALTGEELQIEL